MKPNELRKFSKKELEERLVKKAEELESKKFEVRMKKDNDYASLKFLKKELARINTIIKAGSFAIDDIKDKVEKKTVKKETKKKNSIVRKDKEPDK
ncbi:50S ribosomal protein L29 [Candidatus Dojkabacteria bacterium]|nr:50S ribosomal protein L29 [Candidatus Dojkabacteria bacterium]